MPAIPLPDRPSLENLRNRARTLQRRLRSGDGGALAVVREFHPRLGSLAPGAAAMAGFSRADAQLVIARQHGFGSWNRLCRHLEIVAEFSRSPHRQPVGTPVTSPQELSDEFLRLACLIYDGYDPARPVEAERILAARPEVATASIYTSAAAGEYRNVSALLSADSSLARREGGPFRWQPLMYATYSRIVSPQPGRSTLEAARLLLAAGADPNTGYLWDGLPSAFTALTGAFGRGEGAPPAHPQVTELATMLLEAGADPNDSQTLYNCSLQSPPDDDGYLRLLLRYGLGTGSGGPWHARLGSAYHSPAEHLDQELRKAAAQNLPDRAALLLEHGADPDGMGTGDRADGDHSAREIATKTGHVEVLRLLAGARPASEPADPLLSFLGACMAGQADEARRLAAADPELPARALAQSPDLIVNAAEEGRLDGVRLLVGYGLDVNGRRCGAPGSTALHEAAWNGDMDMITLLLELGADPALKDRAYQGTAAGWAEYNGQQEAAAFLSGLPG